METIALQTARPEWSNPPAPHSMPAVRFFTGAVPTGTSTEPPGRGAGDITFGGQSPRATRPGKSAQVVPGGMGPTPFQLVARRRSALLGATSDPT